jgi:hypothetical protein
MIHVKVNGSFEHNQKSLEIHNPIDAESVMNKKIAVAITLTTAASLSFAGSASARPPAAGSATITGSVTGTPAYYDTNTFQWIDGAASGSLTLEVDQSDPGRNIVMANIDLGSGFSIDSANVTIESDEDGGGGCSTGSMEIEYLGDDDITVKGFSCDDADVDGKIEFSLVATGISASTTVQSAGDYDVESQYRTNGSRRNKAYSWTVENETAITLSDNV